MREREPERWLDDFSNLFHRDMGVVPIRETRIMGPVYVEELDSGFTTEENDRGNQENEGKQSTLC